MEPREVILEVENAFQERDAFKLKADRREAEIERLKHTIGQLQVQAADLATLLAERNDELREAKKRLEVSGPKAPSCFSDIINKQNREIYDLQGKLKRCSALLAGVLTEMRVEPISQSE